MIKIRELTEFIRTHRCFQHPIFEHWVDARPDARTLGALFHQIRSFCDATRPGGAFPVALAELGMDAPSRMMRKIVESEAGHGPDLARMAGFIVNRAAQDSTCPDLNDIEKIHAVLKRCSDELLGRLPGYEPETGLTVQCRSARAVFARRDRRDRASTLRNLGVALALEIISNRHLIPGEKLALVDSGLYGAALEQSEMYYLEEHWGEVGAEAQHEEHAIHAVESVYDEHSAPLLMAGAAEFLQSLAALWDVLDSALLQSGYRAVPDCGLAGKRREAC